MVNTANLAKGISDFRSNWKSTGGKRDFLVKFQERVSQFGVYKAAAMSAVGASNQRALKLNGNTHLPIAKEQCYDLIAKSLQELFSRSAVTVEDFSNWEYTLATEIRKIHKDLNIDDYTYGNAQKWINLSIKYVLWYDQTDYRHDVFKNGYFPIDNIIQTKICQASKRSKNRVMPIGSWGQCDDWIQIKNFQNEARDYIIAEGWYSPIVWEVSHW